MQAIVMLLKECKKIYVPELSPDEIIFQQLQKVAKQFETDEELHKELYGTEGPTNAVVRVKSMDDAVGIFVEIKDGKIEVNRNLESAPGNIGGTLCFKSEDKVREYLEGDIDERTQIFIHIDCWIEGNQSHFAYFSYLLNLLDTKNTIKELGKQKEKRKIQNFNLAKSAGRADRLMRKERIKGRLKGKNEDPGVQWLDDPYLSEYTLDNFQRLKDFKEEYIKTTPEISAEQGELITDFYIANGYEQKKNGQGPWDPTLRMAEAFRYMMSNKEPVYRENDLLAGTLTANPVCGSITQPYTIGWSIWGDLDIIEDRELEPYTITDATRNILHKKVFPFWMNRHLQHVWKQKCGEDNLVPKISDRQFCFVPWSLVSLNPGSPGFGMVLKKGLKGVREEIQKRLDGINGEANEDSGSRQDKINTLEAMKISLDGISSYVKNLVEHLSKEASQEKDTKRKEELENLSRILSKVPENPAETLHEAIQLIWIMYIGIGLESMDDCICVGRLDQMLQPFFEADIEKCSSKDEREAYISRALDLTGCLFIKLTSHRIAADSIRTAQNSGAPATASITVGGVGTDNRDVVNDMTYIILKAAEMLCMDDPDMDARYMSKVNSETYFKRICEVNYLTSGTPAIHNDAAVIEALEQNKGWDVEDIKNWVPCGCVEPVISGKHYGATGDIDTNLTVPLEMALNNGKHFKWNISKSEKPLGPLTGNVSDFETFDEFLLAFEKQFQYLYEQLIVGGSHKILEAQQDVMPSALYSALLDGCIENACGMTHGGAKYNSSGSSFIALSDVIDSLLVIKSLVFDKGEYTFEELKHIVDKNFADDDGRRAYEFAKNRVPKFGSNSEDARVIGKRVTEMLADFFHDQDNNRGGHYSTGYRTNSNNVVYGSFTGALPSGRLEYKPFTSGLTPTPSASKNLMDNMIDISSLNPLVADNNYTFNVRLSFSKHNTHGENVDLISQYVESYFNQGGMQIQFNMVDSDTLRDAMAHPDEYPDLIVRVSGYTGYYTKMQQALQLEIISRTEFGL